jgi:hypothetical protein
VNERHRTVPNRESLSITNCRGHRDPTMKMKLDFLVLNHRAQVPATASFVSDESRTAAYIKHRVVGLSCTCEIGDAIKRVLCKEVIERIRGFLLPQIETY